MKNNYKDRAHIYHESIRRILLHEWDPIGVSRVEEAQDEYDAYVGEIYRMLITRKSEKEISDYLWWLETEHMGLTGDRQKTEYYAKKFKKLPSEIEEEILGVRCKNPVSEQDAENQ